MAHRAGKLGHATAYYNIGIAIYHGEGVELDREKARRYYELAAMRGDVDARYNLGCMEASVGNMDKALKHWMIAIKVGMSDSLNMVKELYSEGHVPKEDYTKALRLYQAYLNEIKSDQRDKAAAEDKNCKYY